MFDRVKAEEMARRCAPESIVMLAAGDCPAGKMDIVMQNGYGGVLVREAIGHPLEADNIAKRIGTFTGKMAFSFCNDFSTAARDKAVESAIRFAQNTTADKNNVLPDDTGSRVPALKPLGRNCEPDQTGAAEACPHSGGAIRPDSQQHGAN